MSWRYTSAPPSTDLQGAAVDAIRTLNKIGVNACFVGGEACALFGVPRKANDLDIFVLTKNWSEESLKRELRRVNPRFYHVRARSRGAKYRVLWYDYSPSIRDGINGDYDFPEYSERLRSIKVDVLLPGVMDIPLFSPSLIKYKRPPHTSANDDSDRPRLPVAPLKLIILTKLQAWSQHRASSVTRFRDKVPIDRSDLLALLTIALKRGTTILPLKPEDSYLPASFINKAKERVAEHVRCYTSVGQMWRELGFDVVETASQVADGRRLVVQTKSPSKAASSPGASKRSPPRLSSNSTQKATSAKSSARLSGAASQRNAGAVGTSRKSQAAESMRERKQKADPAGSLRGAFDLADMMSALSVRAPASAANRSKARVYAREAS